MSCRGRKRKAKEKRGGAVTKHGELGEKSDAPRPMILWTLYWDVIPKENMKAKMKW